MQRKEEKFATKIILHLSGLTQKSIGVMNMWGHEISIRFHYNFIVWKNIWSHCWYQWWTKKWLKCPQWSMRGDHIIMWQSDEKICKYDFIPFHLKKLQNLRTLQWSGYQSWFFWFCMPFYFICSISLMLKPPKHKNVSHSCKGQFGYIWFTLHLSSTLALNRNRYADSSFCWQVMKNISRLGMGIRGEFIGKIHCKRSSTQSCIMDR